MGNKAKVMLYALSTCIWCRKTRALLDSLGVKYDYTYVDLLEGQARTDAEAEVEKHNPAGSYPTLLVGGKCIVGFKEDEIKEEFSNGGK